MTAPSTAVLTIDGPVSSGKGTVARLVAIRLGWHLLDSGALYRVLGYHAKNQGLALDDEPALVELAKTLPVRFIEQEGETAVILDGEDVSNIIRQESVGELASQVAVLQPVRDALLARQRVFAEPPGLVADGRDMGTVVFPDATLKVFLTATLKIRAQRRYKQLLEKGFSATLAGVENEVSARDQKDSTRAVSPLVPANDAVVLDTTEIGIDQVVKKVDDLLTARLAQGGNG